MKSNNDYVTVTRKQLQYVRDLLIEKVYGSSARSPGHNARLEIDSMLSAAPPLEAEAVDWQPIETAPKDGTQILLFWPYITQEGTVTTGHWYRAGKDVPDRWYSPIVNGYATPPTHWMPLPKAPEDTP